MYLYGVRLCTMNNSSRGLLLCRATPPHTKHTEVGRCVECWIRFSKVSRWVRAGRSGYCAESCWIAVLLCNSLPLSPFQYFTFPLPSSLSKSSPSSSHKYRRNFYRKIYSCFPFLFSLSLLFLFYFSFPFLFEYLLHHQGESTYILK